MPNPYMLVINGIISIFRTTYALETVSLNNRIANRYMFTSDCHEDGSFDQDGSLLEVISYVTSVPVAATLRVHFYGLLRND
jgi:hypothetical protein